MLFEPLIWLHLSSNIVEIQQVYHQQQFHQQKQQEENSMNKSFQKEPAIALLELSERQIYEIFKKQVKFTQSETNKLVIVWKCTYRSISNENKASIIYIPNLCKTYEKLQNFITKFMMNICQILIFSINCKHLRSQSNTWPLGRFNQKYYITLNHSSESLLLYEVPISQNFHRLQLSQSISKEQFDTSVCNCYKQLQNKNNKQSWQHALKIIKNKSKSILQWDSNYLFQCAIAEYFLWLDMISNNPLARKIILEKNRISQQKLKQLKLSLDQCQTTKLIEKKLQKNALEEVFQEFCYENQLLMQNFLTNFTQNELGSYTSLQELHNNKQSAKNQFHKFIKSEIIFQGLFSIQQVKLMNSYMSSQQSRQNELLQQINTLSKKVKKQQKVIDQNQKKIIEQTQIIELYQHINKDFLQTQQNLRHYKERNGQLQIEVEKMTIDKAKSEETQEWLRKYIGSLLNEKAQFQQQIDSLSKDNNILMTSNKQTQRQINTLTDKLSQLQQLKQNSRKFIQRQQIFHKKIKDYQSWSQKIQSKYQDFLQVEKQKFNYILQRNFSKFKTTVEKNQMLKEQIEQLIKEKQKLHQQLDIEKNKSQFYQEKMMKFMEIQKCLGSCDDQIILEDNAEYDPTSRKETQREMILNHYDF